MVESGYSGLDWRDRLGRRLAWVTWVLAVAAFAITLTRLDADPDKLMFTGPVLTIVAILTWAVRRRTSPRHRAWVVIGVLLISVGLGASRYGIQAGPSLALASAAVVAALLLGRRAMIFTLASGALLLFLTGLLMVDGTLASPPLDNITPARAEVWVRAGLYSVLFITIIAVAVMWTLEQIERSFALAEQEQARRREAERKALAVQQTELLGQLAAGLAHDLNNHMTVISMSNQVLASNPDPEVASAAGEIASAIEHSTSLTKQLLVLGRRDVRAPSRLSLAEFVRIFAATIHRMVPSDIEVAVSPATHEAWCEVDERQLHQVLLNLALNAKDAMPNGGRLTLSVEERTRSGRAFSVLAVADTGTGMTEDVRLRACEPFYTTKAPGKGSGLGLATAQAIMRQSDGELEIESSVGGGTTITLLFPTTAAAAPSPPRPAAAAPPRVRARVLLVEDMPAVLHGAQRILRKAGCDVVTASDGDEAMKRIEETTFDLLCSDVVMPGVPTRDVIAAFEAKNPTSPVLLCSGYVGQELVRRGIEEHRYRFLAKPYASAQLLQMVEELLAKAPTTCSDDPPTPEPGSEPRRVSESL